MAQLDETDVTLENTAGRDVHVIDKKVPVELNGTDKFVNVGVWFLFIIGGVVYTVKKNHARSYFKQLEQKIQHDASTIDNYMAQRVSILQNTAKLLDKAIALDKETFVDVAKARAGSSTDKDAARNELQGKLDMAQNSIDVVLEKSANRRIFFDILLDFFKWDCYGYFSHGIACNLERIVEERNCIFAN